MKFVDEFRIKLSYGRKFELIYMNVVMKMIDSNCLEWILNLFVIDLSGLCD